MTRLWKCLFCAMLAFTICRNHTVIQADQEKLQIYTENEQIRIISDGETQVGYCLDSHLLRPKKSKPYIQYERKDGYDFTKAESLDCCKDEYSIKQHIQSILYQGYPHNQTNLQATLSDEKFEELTQKAIYSLTNAMEWSFENQEEKDVYEQLLKYYPKSEFVDLYVFGTKQVSKYQPVISSTLMKYPLTLLKIDESSKLPLSQVEFEITDDENQKQICKTNQEGKIKLDLYPGTYTILETKPPQGYDGLSKKRITIQKDGTILHQDQVIEGCVIVANKKHEKTTPYQIKVKKTWDDAYEAHPEVVIGLYENGTCILKRTLKEPNYETVFLDLDPSKSYTIQEETKLDSYVCRKDVIEKDDGIQVFLTNHLIQDLPTGILFTVYKLDQDEKPLQKAIFSLTNLSTNKTQTITSDANGQMYFFLEQNGSYLLNEISAPSGYLIDPNTYHVEVCNGKVRLEGKECLCNQFTLQNYKRVGNLKLIKIDAQTKTPLEGAIFLLKEKESGNTLTKTSNQEGIVLFDNLQDGEYQLYEKQAPTSYHLIENSVQIRVQDGQVYQIQDEEVSVIETLVVENRQEIPHTKDTIHKMLLYFLSFALLSLYAKMILIKYKPQK